MDGEQRKKKKKERGRINTRHEGGCRGKVR